MAVTAGLSVKDATPEFLRLLRALADREVLVGIPSDDEQPHLGTGTVGTNARRPDPQGRSSPVTNALIGYVHEHGEPSSNVPARPHLVPGVQDAREKIVARLEGAGRAALRGDEAAVDRYLHAAGQEAVTSVKRKLQAGVPPPLKDATVRARRRRSKGSRYRRKATNANDVTALIDTGAYIASISFVVRKGKRR